MTKETPENVFQDLEWHDAILLDVRIDRRDPGRRDEVVLTIEWTDGVQQDLRFTGCYEFHAQMNFGIIALESIRDANCVDDSEDLRAVKERWVESGFDFSSLREFEITMNSTASVLRILACGLEISSHDAGLSD